MTAYPVQVWYMDHKADIIRFSKFSLVACKMGFRNFFYPWTEFRNLGNPNIDHLLQSFVAVHKKLPCNFVYQLRQ